MHKQIFKPHKRFKFFEFSDYGVRNCIKKSKPCFKEEWS